MSLTVNGSAGGANFAPIEEGTHLGVCCMLIDLGLQYNETYKSSSRKVLIGWEIPDQTIELDDGPHPRNLFRRYTASLNERASLRADLAAWRGRDFTPEELAAFDLRNILGKSCLINVIHKEYNGKTSASIQNIMALPKGMQAGKLSGAPVVFDLDADPLEEIEHLPAWIGEVIRKSETYKDRVSKKTQDQNPFSELGDEEEELPF